MDKFVYRTINQTACKSFKDAERRDSVSNGNEKDTKGKQVYLKLNQITEVQKKDVYLKDVAKVACQDPALLNKCNCLKIKKIREDRQRRYVEDVIDVIDQISQLDPNIQVDNLGEIDYIIDYHPPKANHQAWQWMKTIFVCIISFCGAAFAIMTFNNAATGTITGFRARCS